MATPFPRSRSTILGYLLIIFTPIADAVFAGAAPVDPVGPSWAEVSRRAVQTHLRLRTSPSIEPDNVAARLAPGTRVWLLEPEANVSGFVRVATPLGVGWVAARPYLEPLGPSPLSTVPPSGPPASISLLGVRDSDPSRPSSARTGTVTETVQPVEIQQAASDLLSGNPMDEALTDIGSPFGLRPWIGGIGSLFHQGVDLKAENPKPIYALGTGTIERAHYGLRSGWTLTTRHGRYMVRYLHLAQRPLSRGSVYRRMHLGATGNSGYDRRGRPYVPHLHFELWENGRPIDPVKYRSIGRTLRYVPGRTARWRNYGWPFHTEGR